MVSSRLSWEILPCKDWHHEIFRFIRLRCFRSLRLNGRRAFRRANSAHLTRQQGQADQQGQQQRVFSALGSSSLFKLTSVYHIPRNSPYRFTEIFSSAKQQVVKKSSSIERFPGCKKQRRFSQQTGAAFFVSFSPPAQYGSLWGAVRSFRANNRSGAHLR